MTDPTNNHNLKDTRYELFMLALSTLAIFNAFVLLIPRGDPIARQVIYLMGAILSFPLMGDFLYRFFTAASKRDYVLREWGWTDFLAGLPNPVLNAFRLVRGAWVLRALRLRGKTAILRDLERQRWESAIFLIAMAVFLLLEFGGWAIVRVEARDPAANIKSGADGLWWVFVTITTVGYGDRVPVTAAGRIVGVLTMAVGVATLGIVTGTLSARFVRFSMGEDESERGPDRRLDAMMQILEDQAKSTAAMEERLDRIERKLPDATPKAKRKPG